MLANEQPRDGCERNVKVTNVGAGSNSEILSYKWGKPHLKRFLPVSGRLAR